MANRDTHIEDCMKFLGAPFDKVHAYLDFYVQKYPPYIYLEYHRKFRHNRKGVEKCLEVFGPLGEKAAKIHLIRDVYIFIFISKQFKDMLPNEIEHYYEMCLQFHPPTNVSIDEYIIIDKTELSKLDL